MRWTDRVPLIVEAIRALPVTSATFDDEGVVADERGLTDFEVCVLRSAFLCAFDLLELDGENLRPRCSGERAWRCPGCCAN